MQFNKEHIESIKSMMISYKEARESIRESEKSIMELSETLKKQVTDLTDLRKTENSFMQDIATEYGIEYVKAFNKHLQEQFGKI